MVLDNHQQELIAEGGQTQRPQSIPHTTYYHEGQADHLYESGHSLAQRAHPPVDNEMISNIGINGILLGFLTVFAGLFQVFGIPALCNDYVISASLKADNLFGFAIWCGSVNIVSSTTALRVTISKRQSTLHRYIFCHAVTMVFYFAAAAVTIKTFTALPYHTLSGCEGLGQGIGVGLIFSGLMHSVVSLFFINTTIQDRMRAFVKCCFGVLFRKDNRPTDCVPMSITQNRRGNVQANDGEIDHRAYRYDELSD